MMYQFLIIGFWVGFAESGGLIEQPLGKGAHCERTWIHSDAGIQVFDFEVFDFWIRCIHILVHDVASQATCKLYLWL